MVTPQRETLLRELFLKQTSLTLTPTTLDLKQCYDILFTEAEKEHLTYDFFLEDWVTYCEQQHGGSDKVGVSNTEFSRDGMTVDVALDFLREMQ